MSVLATKLRLACAFKARALANGVFVSGIDARRLAREDAGFNPFFRLARPRIDRRDRRVTCSILGTGLFRETAVCVDGIGAVLLAGAPEATVRAWPRIEGAAPSTVAAPEAWPAAAPGPGRPDHRKVHAAVDRLFVERDRKNLLRTRAVLVLHDGCLVAERYAPGFGPDTRFLSWSMAKSMTSALLGILAGQGRVRMDEPAPVPEWADPADPRHAITPSQLLRMSSGLAWTETYGEQPISDVNRMLFLVPDMAAFAAGRPPGAAPGTTFQYASGSTNILCRMMRDLFPTREEYLAFPRRALFEPLDMRSAVWGTDATGTLVGSSFVFATARDFARFGQLCLDDGMWRGRRILPEGWMAWATTPTPTDPAAEYGAGFWLNRDPVEPGRTRAYPKLPTDFYYANGHQGQMIGVIPSRRLVVVRLGMTWGSEWGREEFLAELLEA